MRSGYMPVKKALQTGGAALHGDIVDKHRPFIADAVDVGRLANHQATMINARLHPADVVAHDEENVGACWLVRWLALWAKDGESSAGTIIAVKAAQTSMLLAALLSIFDKSSLLFYPIFGSIVLKVLGDGLKGAL